MKNIFKNKWVLFSSVTIAYILVTIWIGNYWLLFGLGIVFDLYITRKVNWTFWKKRGVEKHSTAVEWIDALIFAVIAASLIRMLFIEAFTIPTSSMEKSLLVGDYLFVSKVSYGPKMPNTPISFPFAHHTLPLTNKKSYLEWIKRPYHRLAGLGDVERNNVVVFNFPEGDTVILQHPDQSYYALKRDVGREYLMKNFDYTVRPVDKRENYIKRCVAVPGDSLEIVNRQVYVNGEKQILIENLQYKYYVKTNGSAINSKILTKLNISVEDRKYNPAASTYMLPLSSEKLEEIKKLANVVSVDKVEKADDQYAQYIFPHSPNYAWNEDNFGPLWIPKKGATVDLTVDNLPLYERIIGVYENNNLQVMDGTILINGEKADKYTFKMDYYFMMGDSRHNSADSRFWGFVPEDHVVGKAVFVWMSLDKDKSGFSKVRWKRLFSVIK